jgi:hypothetical protein
MMTNTHFLIDPRLLVGKYPGRKSERLTKSKQTESAFHSSGHTP